MFKTSFCRSRTISSLGDYFMFGDEASLLFSFVLPSNSCVGTPAIDVAALLADPARNGAHDPKQTLLIM